ncbi:hypothetical protein [Rhodococcus rhodochrous]|uniref:hypothetical protein n=1 Tax=Rhodococcus rhodochrous TaxID=1829 RepID=UPI0011AE2743|nr:hypothetical protein [Rhodococcus rhodochrous]
MSRYAPRGRWWWWWVRRATAALAFIAVVGWFYVNPDMVVLWGYVPAGEATEFVARAVGHGQWATWATMGTVLTFVLGFVAVMMFGKGPQFKEKATRYWLTAPGMALCALGTGVFVLACTISAIYTLPA